MRVQQPGAAWIDSVLGHLPERFSNSEDTHDLLVDSVRKRYGSGSASIIGTSEEGRPIYGFVIGDGPLAVSLIAGNHADEPVGPETLRAFVRALADCPEDVSELTESFTFRVVPHCNPDGEFRNRPWMELWPDLEAFLDHAVREEPGRDLEFGFPDLRVENRVVSAFLEAGAPYAVHMSLHGMAFSRGALLLIDRRHAPHATIVRQIYAAAVAEAGLELHDENRGGEKGFFYLGPGFWTTPEGSAMRDHFTLVGDPDLATAFRNSSMEYVESLGGLPLSLVTELPLFVLDASAPASVLPQLRAWRRGSRGDSAGGFRTVLEAVRAVPVTTSARLQLHALRGGLAYVRSGRASRIGGLAT